MKRRRLNRRNAVRQGTSVHPHNSEASGVYLPVTGILRPAQRAKVAPSPPGQRASTIRWRRETSPNPGGAGTRSRRRQLRVHGTLDSADALGCATHPQKRSEGPKIAALPSADRREAKDRRCEDEPHSFARRQSVAKPPGARLFAFFFSIIIITAESRSFKGCRKFSLGLKRSATLVPSDECIHVVGDWKQLDILAFSKQQREERLRSDQIPFDQSKLSRVTSPRTVA